jgi:predicted DNA-binding transcriptional regulator AlpA
MTPNQNGRLIDAHELSSMLGLNLFTCYRMKDTGKIPAAVKIGSAIRWRLGEIQGWIAAGCPPRAKWEAMRGDG